MCTVQVYTGGGGLFCTLRGGLLCALCMCTQEEVRDLVALVMDKLTALDASKKPLDRLQVLLIETEVGTLVHVL